jgi:DNA-binding LacI/PurR family transcriptional regulator
MVEIAMLRREMAGGRLVEEIVQQIDAGQLRPGDPLLSATNLAKQYKVSYATAHKAISGLAKDGYCVRMRGAGTFISRNRPPRRVTAVGIPAYHQTNPFLAHMIEELTLQSAVQGIHAIVGRAERTGDFVEKLARNGVKAMIRFPGRVGPGDPAETDIWRMLQEHGMATVMINDFWREGGPFPHVRTDEGAGVAEMMDHLISLGHKRILLVMEMLTSSRPEAVMAHREAYERHGLHYDDRFVMGLCRTWDYDKETVIRQMLETATAAIVIYDMYAVQLANEFRRLGVVLGRDFSLAGFDGIHEAEEAGLSTIVQPVAELVATAYSLLQNPPRKEAPKIKLKPKCVFRSTTGAAPRGKP